MTVQPVANERTKKAKEGALAYLVRDAFSNAEENGYGAELRAMTPDEQVSDLMAFDALIAGFRRSDVFKAVLAYRKGAG